MFANDFTLENAKLLQQQILNQCIDGPALERVALGTENERAAHRRFFRAYQFRSIFFRLAPRLAARLVL